MELTRYNRGLTVDGSLWLGAAYESPGISIEASKSNGHYGFGITLGGEERDLMFNAGLPLLGSVYVSFRGWTPNRVRSWLRKRAEARAQELCEGASYQKVYAYQLDWFGLGVTTGLSLFEDHLTLRIFSDNDRTHGWYWSVFLKDAVLGRETYTTTALTTFKETVRMPEGAYDANVKVSKVTRTRRFTGTKRSLRFSVEVEEGVPMAGKGENSYDCGEDATYSISFPEIADDVLNNANLVTLAASYAEQFAKAVCETRQRRQGHVWPPGREPS